MPICTHTLPPLAPDLQLPHLTTHVQVLVTHLAPVIDPRATHDAARYEGHRCKV